MPVLIDDDLCFVDSPRVRCPALTVNRWLRGLPPAVQDGGEIVGPARRQIERVKDENAQLRNRLAD
jgi:hypothetical protein